MAYLQYPTSLVPSGSFRDPLEFLNEGFDDLTMKIRTTIESGLSAWEDDDFQAHISSINPQGSNSECPTGVATPGITPQQMMIEDEELPQLLKNLLFTDCFLGNGDFEELCRGVRQQWEFREPGRISSDNESGHDWFGDWFDDWFGDKASLLLLPDTSQEPNIFGAGDDDLIGIYTAQPAEDPPGLTTSSRTGRRCRSRNWTPEEKEAYLKVKVEGLRCVKGKDWDFISKTLATRYKIHISSKSCEDLWGTLRKSYKLIRDHEGMCRSSVGRTSYFTMAEEEKIAHKLPKSFPLEWCKMMERILKARGKLKCEESCSPDVPGYSSAFPSKDGSTDPLSNLEPSLQSNLQINESTNSRTDLLNSSSTSMAKEKLKSYLHKVFMDALQPIASLLQCREREQEEYEAKLQTIAKKRRALDLEEMQLKRQRAGQHPRTRSKYRTK